MLLLAFLSDVGISVLLLNVPTSIMSNFNTWRDDNRSQHTSPDMSTESSLMPTQFPSSPVDFEMGPVLCTADNFARMYQN